MKQLTPKGRQSAPLLIPRVPLLLDRRVMTCISTSMVTDATATSEEHKIRMGLDRQSRRRGKGFLLLILAILALLSLIDCGVASAGVNTWTSNGPEGGIIYALAIDPATPVLTGDTGAFWFFSSNNVEMVIKVLNGSGFNSRYWTFAGGLTDVNVLLTVTDTQTGAIKTYTNPQGTPFQPIQDTSAFGTCP